MWSRSWEASSSRTQRLKCIRHPGSWRAQNRHDFNNHAGIWRATVWPAISVSSFTVTGKILYDPILLHFKVISLFSRTCSSNYKNKRSDPERSSPCCAQGTDSPCCREARSGHWAEGVLLWAPPIGFCSVSWRIMCVMRCKFGFTCWKRARAFSPLILISLNYEINTHINLQEDISRVKPLPQTLETRGF